ncbi:hypothetical protein U9R90_35875, partial [Streptomyces sp. E11-3]
THESPAPTPGLGGGGLPKRPRGRTLAAAEAAQARAATATGRAADSRTAAESAARFGSFRQAVRGAAPPGQDETTDPRPTAQHPEGDTTR